MYYIFRILFLLFLILYGRGKSTLFKMFVCLQVISFVAEYLIDAYHVKTDDFLTYFYVILSVLMLTLLNTPWAHINITQIAIRRKKFQSFLERSLIYTLSIIFLINLIVAVVVITLIPDVSDYKLKDGWKDLYETIPMFALLNRISYITQYMGYFALPISFYYFSKNENKRGLLFLFLTSASLMAGIAQYSRAQMLVFILCFFANFFLYQNLFSKEKLSAINKYAYRGVVVLVAIFLYTTINRFSSENMAHYGDRIPKTSLIQEPTLYSIMDYTAQGFPNGINQLVNYTPSKCFNGQDTFYYPLLFLNYFGIIDWDPDEAMENRDKVFDNDGGGFHGYTCSFVYDFGIFMTICFGLVYYSFVKRKVCRSSSVDITKAIFLSFIIMEPANSIFYSSIGTYSFPLLFYLTIKFMYFIKVGFIKKKLKTAS